MNSPQSPHHPNNAPSFESSISPLLVIVSVVASAILTFFTGGAFLFPALLLLGGLYLLHRHNQPLNFTQAGARLSLGHLFIALFVGLLFLPWHYALLLLLAITAFLLLRKK